MPTTRLPALLLALLAGSVTAHARTASQHDADTLRAQGSSALPPLLARWDTMPAGPARDELARTIDQVAGQRYATVSRLYWHTDLASAKAAAKAQYKPILALRMLGRLDEDLSCANSRLFRATLYANKGVSQFLRDNFILYWSSERDVPRVTIDFGDGRKIAGTTTGNSAHYVLDAEGSVLDVLPGLYAPAAFKAELTKSLSLARWVAKIGVAGRATTIANYHRKALEDTAKTWAQLDSLSYIADRGMLLGRGDLASTVALAQRATISKAYIEVPALTKIASGLNPGELDEESADQWATIGQFVWQIGDEFAQKAVGQPSPGPRDGEPVLEGATPPMRIAMPGRGRARLMPPLTLPNNLPSVLDAASRTLVASLHNSGPVKATAVERNYMIARLEHHLVADSALNQFKLRTEIHRHLAQQVDRSFDSVNTFVYSEVFHTPRQDAWLGLLPRTDFTGLPGDGVVMP